MLFSTMLTHDVVLQDLLLYTLVPRPKNKRGNKCDSNNNRQIATHVYIINTHVDIINEDVLVRLYYTCKNQQLHLDVNHYVLNKLIRYLFFIRYIMIIKSNTKQTTVCADPTICLQLMNWLTFMYSYFISRSFYKCIIFILIFKIINLPPISLNIVNLMESICESLTYNELNIFDCMKLIHSMEPCLNLLVL